MFCSKTYRTAAALSRMSQSEILGGILRGGRGHVAALATQGLPPMPHWQPDPEDERQAAHWPLRLLTAPGYFQSHTAFSGVSYLRRREGTPCCCILHPQEAGARPPRWSACTFAQRSGFGRARLHGYRRGSARKSARPGAAYDGEMLSGTINMLCSQRYTDIGEGATYQSSWLEIAAWADSARWTRDRVYLCS